MLALEKCVLLETQSSKKEISGKMTFASDNPSSSKNDFLPREHEREIFSGLERSFFQFFNAFTNHSINYFRVCFLPPNAVTYVCSVAPL